MNEDSKKLLEEEEQYGVESYINHHLEHINSNVFKANPNKTQANPFIDMVMLGGPSYSKK